MHKKQIVFILLLVALLTPLASIAQNRTGSRINDPNRTNTYQQLQQQFAIATNTINGLLVLEGALDPDTYIVGPGDQFSLSIGGPTPIQVVLPISAEGNLLLWDVGNVSAAGKTLSELRVDVIAALQNQYEYAAIDINLLQPRRFYVHLAGSIPEPGRYLMLPLARLDDAVQQAFASQATARPDPTAGGEVRIVGSATSEVPQTQNGFNPSLRNVLLTHRDGSTEVFDLFAYYLNGDLTQNPYLSDGDVIRLTSYNEAHSAILVTGDVSSPGRIEYKAGDTVLDALRLTASEQDIEGLTTVRLTRRNNGETPVTIDLSVPELLDGTRPPLTLLAGDHINVKMEEYSQASVYGFVKYPGTFPIENAKTTLKELVTLAGGLKPEASVRSAYIERRQSQARKPNSETSDLDFFERTYFQRSLSKNNISINIESALEPDAEELLLYSGDVIVFPRDEQTIHVVGNALKPGYIPYVPGKTAAYYIELAGGEAPMTTGRYVFEAGSGKVYADKGAILRPGDTIFINRESIASTPDLQALLITDEVSKRQTRIARTQTIITGITALVSVVNTFLLIRDRLNN
ncbi:MAG: SLBB domain-containing protein [Rhodothermales bacterium]